MKPAPKRSAPLPPRRLAWIAFWFHAPGLWLAGAPLPRHLYRANEGALAATAAVTLIVAGLVPTGWGWWAGLGAWGLGHVLWGGWLAWRIFADVPPPPD